MIDGTNVRDTICTGNHLIYFARLAELFNQSRHPRNSLYPAYQKMLSETAAACRLKV